MRTAPERRWHLWLVAFVTGALPALAFPEPSVWPLGVAGLVPLMAVVATAPTRREAILRVWLGGVGFFIAVHHWLIPVTGPFVVPLAAALAVLWIPWGFLLWWLLSPQRRPASLAAALVVVPSAWVTAEYLRSWDRLGGPWGLLGATQWSNEPLLAVASYGGVWLLSFLLVAVNTAVTAAVLPGSSRPWRVAAAAAAAGILVVCSLAPGFEPKPVTTLRVAGVQTGVLHDPEERLAAHEHWTETLIGEDVDLVVWAESSIGLELDASRTLRLSRLASRLDAPLLVNVDARAGEGGIYKASVLIVADGLGDRYDKMRLVPFGEYIPLRPVLGWVAAFTDAADEDRRRGDGLVVMEIGDASVGPLVCFESAFPDMSRRLVAAGADVIVLQTATTTFQGSWAQPQHASLAAVRAVETGRPVVHAALSGVTAVFAADGRLITELDGDATGVWGAEITVTEGETFYVRTGDWAAGLSVLVTVTSLIVVLRADRFRRRP